MRLTGVYSPMSSAPSQRSLTASTTVDDAVKVGLSPVATIPAPIGHNKSPLKGLPPWGSDYLVAMVTAEGYKIKAAGLIGMSYKGVYDALVRYPELSRAVDEIRVYYDSQHLAQLEDLSIRQALKPGCTIERLFLLKAHDPARYREKSQAQAINFQINFGFPTPDAGGAIEASYTTQPAARHGVTDADMGE